VGEGRHKSHLPVCLNVALLTVSDTRTVTTDRSGATLKQLLASGGHRLADYRIVPDEPDQIRLVLDEWLSDETCEAIITTGGTGIAVRDRTYEAVSALLEKRIDGFGELFRMLSYEQVGSTAMLSRAIAGVARGKPVFALPGSPAAVELALERLILPELGHLMAELRLKT
jgi:molybdenum cofactor biosynthesis protein B